MKVFRFMSLNELNQLLLKGEICNFKNHKKLGGHTNSIGFCFFSCNDFTPEEAWRFLKGIENYDICVVFETRKKLKKSRGKYAKYEETIEEIMKDIEKLKKCKTAEEYTEYFKNTNTFIATEYCTTSYNKKDFKVLKLGITDIFGKIDWIIE